MSLEIMYHGILAEAAGCQKEKVDHVATVRLLRKSLIKDHPGLKKLSFIFAINDKIGQNTGLNPGDRVTLIPPMPGG